MKLRLLSLLALLIFVIFLSSCDTEDEAKKTSIDKQSVYSAPAPSPTPTPTPTPSTEECKTEIVGMIIGNLYYMDIEVVMLFEYPFEDILGTPLGHESYNHFFYDGLNVNWPYWNDLTGRFEQALQVTGSNLTLFNIDGITLDKTRDELIGIFGPPLDDPTFALDEYIRLKYYIMLRGVEYLLEFWFDYPDSIASRLSISKASD